MMKIEDKFEAAISDTDILIDLYKSGCMELFSLLFNRIFITEYIFEKELKRVAGKDFTSINSIISDEKSPFEVVWEKDLDIATKNSKRAFKQSRENLVGPGELDCACHAHATGINFVVSNNHTEFKYLDDIAIMLCHYHILAICVFHNKITEEKAERYYNSINMIKSKPSSHTFSKKLNLSWDYFNENGLVDILKLTHCVE